VEFSEDGSQEMSDQGKANYEGYRAAILALMPKWEELSYPARLAWDAGAVSAITASPELADLDKFRDALQRLADEDTPVLDQGLGGGATEELHVRINLARQALGLDVCGCTECMVSLGIDPDEAE
jgi:hypothetical protein